MSVKKTGIVLAGVAAALLASGVVSTAFANTNHKNHVKCMGTNECKGKGACKTAKNACKGQNGCKGMGWVEMKTADECTKAKGTVMEDKH